MIGARRSSSPRSWRAGVIALAMLGVICAVTWLIYRRAVEYDVPAGEVTGALGYAQAEPGAPAALSFGTASLAWLGGVPVLRAIGDAHALGAAHGRLLAPWLESAVRALAPSVEQTVSRDGWLAGSTHTMRVAWRWRFIDDGQTDADRRLAAGLARGAQASGVPIDYTAVVRGQAVLDVGEPSPRSAEAADRSIARSLAIVARPAGAPARLWLGRAFAVPGLDDGGDAAIPVVTIAHPDGKIAWAGVGWPGGLGVVTGVNARGIAILVSPARTADVRIARAARPIALLARSVLEQAATLDEAVKLIEATPTLGAAAVAIADARGAWVLIERTPTRAIVDRAPRSPVIGDVLTTQALAADPENDRARRVLPSGARVDRAARLVRAPLPDVAALAAILRDPRTADERPRPPGHRGAIDDGRAIHLAILDPTTLELWVADPSAAGQLRGIDLRYELRREGQRPQPPADIAAAPDAAADPARAAVLAAARADLRVARAALRAGELARAAEASARARARAPWLPEALELDGLIALALGDLPRARAALQAWLDGGADDPAGEERARALLTR
jgi:hypothetical protein